MSTSEAEIEAVIQAEEAIPVAPVVQAVPDLKSQFSESFLQFFPLMNSWCIDHCKYYRPKPHKCLPSVPGCLLTSITGLPLGKDLENILKRILTFSKP